jgi:hypothetical protein
LVLGDAYFELLHLQEGFYHYFCLINTFKILKISLFLAVIASLMAVLRIKISFAEISELKLSSACGLIFAVFDHLRQLLG